MQDAAKTKKQLIGELVELRQQIDQIKRASEGEYKLGGPEQHEAHILLRAMIEGTTDAVFIKDLRGHYVTANSATANFIGKPLEEIIGKDDTQLFSPDTARQIMETDRRILTSGKTETLEEIGTAMGISRTYLSTKGAYRDNQGNVIGLFGIARDITERKRTEKALRESEEKYRLIFNTVPIGIFHYNKNGVVTECNTQFTEIIGAPYERIIDFNMLENLKDESMLNAIRTSLSGKNSLFDGEYTSVAGGKTTYIKAHFVPITSENNAVVGGVGVIENITVQVKAQEALRESEELHRNILESMSDGVLALDSNFHYTHWNRAMEKISNVPRDQLLETQKLPWEVFPHLSQQGVDLIMRKAMRGEVSSRGDIPYSLPDGKEGFTSDVFLPLKMPNGEIRGIVGVIRDITERKQAEELLQTEKDKLEIITQNIGAGLCIISKDYRTLWANKVLKQIFGEVEGKVCYETYNQQTDVCPNCGVREIFETGKDKVIHEEVGKDADGQTIWSEIIASPIRNKEGDIVSVLELVVPITERKLAEDALRESEVRFKSTAEMLQTAIVEHDLNGIVTYANSHALEMTGYSLEDIKEGLSVMQAIAPEDHEKRYRRLQKAIQGEILQPEEYRLLHKSGSIVWGLVSSEIIRQDGDAVGVRTSVIDITRRKEAEEALKKRTKDLELKTKSLEELNTAMKVLLKKREADKTEIEENVMTNVKELIAPYFDKINKTKLDDHQKVFLNILESNLNEIVSPFTRKLSLKYLSLTPKEIQIVNMIKIGYPSKKIAKIMKISPRTVDTHRKNIRSKIGLGKKKANLRSHLLAYEQ